MNTDAYALIGVFMLLSFAALPLILFALGPGRRKR